MVQSRIALEGLTIERTVARLFGRRARAPGACTAAVRARRVWQSVICPPPACGGTPEAAVARARRAVKQSIAVTVLT